MASKTKFPFIVHLLILFAFIAFLYILFFKSLGLITRHGHDVEVPSVLGRDLRVAKEQLEKMGFEVTVDSTFDSNKKPFEVVGQLPEVGESVKIGRTLFLTVNKSMPPTIAMPNLNGVSIRSAMMILKSNKLLMGDTTYIPDIAKGAILQQKWKGSLIKPGTLLAQGSTIDLVIGDGLGNTEFNVPDVIGLPAIEAIANLNALGLQYTLIADGEITDSLTALVYLQIPNSKNEIGANNRIREGDLVDLRIKQNPTQEEMEFNRNPEQHLQSNDSTSNNNSDNPFVY